jgi:23S rRNA pseudouridine2605 synthase
LCNVYRGKMGCMSERNQSGKHDNENIERAEGEERLARFLAHAGIASRRHAEELIAAGRVQVNGTTITTQGARIDPQRDRVSVDGRVVSAVTKHVYLLLHKPTGYVSTARDPQGRPTVLDLLPPDIRQLRVYPVGRLDIDTSGLLVLTNDGDFALHLTHPRYALEKRYEVLVRGIPSTGALDALRRGVEFSEDDGSTHTSAPAQVRLLGRAGAGKTWLALTIHEGRKRQVRRMLASVGYTVQQLTRVAIGPLTLEALPAGKWRYLTDREVTSLLSQ